jgi:hypothetical protein
MGASTLGNRFRYLAVGLLSAVLLLFRSAMAWADDSVTFNFVRHGESGDMSVINTLVPGPHLTPTGDVQADALVGTLGGNNYDGIYASTMVRSWETAQPLAQALGFSSVPQLSGLNEINAGIFEGLPVNVGGLPLGGAAYLLAPAMWTLGLDFVPELGSTDANGIVFDNRVDGAIQAIYNTGDLNGDGNISDAVFSHEGTIAVWSLMNAKNPDFPLVLNELLKTGKVLPYTGVVELQGDPTDGWTLVNWDGQPVPQDPGLPTQLFVDLRDFITAPQFAANNIWEALLTGNPTMLENAIGAGINQVGAATVNFPIAVFTDIINAVQNDILSGFDLNALLGDFSPTYLSADLASLLPGVASDVAGLLPGELATLVGNALAFF